MITPAHRAEIRRLFYAEHWKVGTIAAALGVHRDTVLHAIEAERFHAVRGAQARPTQLDPYLPFVRETLEQYPKLRATRLYEMLRARGYGGSVVQLRRLVRPLRPRPLSEAFLRLRTLPGEQAQVDWGSFGAWGERRLSCFVMVLSWSRALHALFTLDQSMESFLRGHCEAFEFFGGAPRQVLYDYVSRYIIRLDVLQDRSHRREVYGGEDTQRRVELGERDARAPVGGGFRDGIADHLHGALRDTGGRQEGGDCRKADQPDNAQ